ncbi:hypothetical protein [Methyloversatilis discipulorum]|uniref:hypothetical protein n=1 Tax=Methyloversatilis discipulorum TaxID=1119528 RepID=UPI001A59CC71|nr:hypothetical protein [Methyloversatilis discipulorum]MBL8466881.1 hypothetical protein [Methyloversatilis discipulorum]
MNDLHHLEIPNLPHRAFRTIGNRLLSLEGGKSDAPEAPDYAAAAKETAKGNAEAARVAAKANRVDQYTPYGNLTYYNPTSNQFNQAGYDAAMQRYQSDLAAYNKGGAGGSAALSVVPGMENLNQPGRSVSGPVGAAPKMPTREQFMTGYDPDRWALKVELSPDQQKLLDAQSQTSIGLAGLQNQGLEYVSNMLSKPFDQSVLPASTVNAGETAQDAILRRMQPTLDRQDEALRSRLQNQGITIGSDAYGAEMFNQAQRNNDLQLAAAVEGINVGNQARQQAIQEQSFFRNEPLNTLNAVRTGSQVTNPSFTNVPQQQTTAGPDLLSAANMQYGADLDAFNASRQAAAGLWGGLFDLGGAALMSPWIGGKK